MPGALPATTDSRPMKYVMSSGSNTSVVFGRDGGVLNVPDILRTLREVRFTGYIAIEYEANPNDPSPDVRGCLDVFRESVRALR